jgi:glyoxylase-like metal-dependent hydrolase (beta-lactamase superfamily II)
MSVGNETVLAKHYGPGHTGGDIVAFFEAANVAHVGDLVFNHRHPFVDRPSGASVRGWISSLESITGELFDDTIDVFGHAKDGRAVTGGKTDLLAQRGYFSAVLEHVEGGIAAGRSRDEVSSLEALLGFGDYVDSPPRLTLTNVLGVTYDELMR